MLQENDRVRSRKKHDIQGTILRFCDFGHTQFIVKLNNGQFWEGSTQTFEKVVE